MSIDMGTQTLKVTDDLTLLTAEQVALPKTFDIRTATAVIKAGFLAKDLELTRAYPPGERRKGQKSCPPQVVPVEFLQLFWS